ncbi:MAG: DedA family protein [Oligoflexales bacterium]|nr:DedA family protein [Oligoflexales bacterium]
MEFLNYGVDFIYSLIDFILHIDVHLNELAASFGPWLYVILFFIIFCETGLVLLPLLPGDSLLFAVGALAALTDSPINVHLVAVLLFIAAVLGDATNYYIGHKIGPRVFRMESNIFFNKAHLFRAQAFYEKHGGKTIIIARFIPIIRTFAPFVAGIGQMKYPRFAAFNIVGALAWVPSFLYLGYFIGNIPAVKSNFSIIIIGIIILSIMPAVIEVLRNRRSEFKPVPR